MNSQVAAALATAVVGGLIALQAPINSHLGKATGTFAAALISFSIGTIVLLGIVAVTGHLDELSGMTNVRWYYLLGGVLGAAYVTTLLGRKRRIPELRSRKWPTRSLGERLAVNTPIQGTAADIIKIAMVRCDARLRERGMRTRLVLTIHDELLYEGPEDEVEEAVELVRAEMEGACELDPPLKVDVGVGDNWLEAK